MAGFPYLPLDSFCNWPCIPHYISCSHLFCLWGVLKYISTSCVVWWPQRSCVCSALWSCSVQSLRYDSINLLIFFSPSLFFFFVSFISDVLVLYCSTLSKDQLGYPHIFSALLMWFSSASLSWGSVTILWHLSSSIMTTPNFWCSGWYVPNGRYWSVSVAFLYTNHFTDLSCFLTISVSRNGMALSFSSPRVNFTKIDLSTWLKYCVRFSPTQRLHNSGLQLMDAVVIASCSDHSMNKHQKVPLCCHNPPGGSSSEEDGWRSPKLSTVSDLWWLCMKKGVLLCDDSSRKNMFTVNSDVF